MTHATAALVMLACVGMATTTRVAALPEEVTANWGLASAHREATPNT